MRLVQQPKFLLVQYAPGAAGKFLASLLMSSKSLSHFDPMVEKNKTKDACVRYIETHFSWDLENWVRNEPKHADAWNLHFISSKFARGDELSLKQFYSMSEIHATDHFVQSVNQNKIIPNIWHKTNTPEYFKNSLFVTVIIDENSLKWYHRALWYKLHGWKNQKIYLKMHDATANPIMSDYVKKFNNAAYSDEKFLPFIKNHIIRNEFKQRFLSTEQFLKTPSRCFVTLSEILDLESCVECIDRIVKELDLTPVPRDVIRRGHTHWSSCNVFKYNNRRPANASARSR